MAQSDDLARLGASDLLPIELDAAEFEALGGTATLPCIPAAAAAVLEKEPLRSGRT